MVTVNPGTYPIRAGWEEWPTPHIAVAGQGTLSYTYEPRFIQLGGDRTLMVTWQEWEQAAGPDKGRIVGRVYDASSGSLVAGPSFDLWTADMAYYNYRGFHAAAMGSDYYLIGYNPYTQSGSALNNEVLLLVHVSGTTLTVTDSRVRATTNQQEGVLTQLGANGGAMLRSGTAFNVHHMSKVTRSGSSLVFGPETVVAEDRDHVAWGHSANGTSGFFHDLSWNWPFTVGSSVTVGSPINPIPGNWTYNHARYTQNYLSHAGLDLPNPLHPTNNTGQSLQFTLAEFNNSGSVVRETADFFRGNHGWTGSRSRYVPHDQWRTGAGDSNYRAVALADDLYQGNQTWRRPFLVWDAWGDQGGKETSGVLSYDWSVANGMQYWAQNYWDTSVGASENGAFVAVSDYQTNTSHKIVWVVWFGPPAPKNGWQMSVSEVIES